jgi:hypothetical protein
MFWARTISLGSTVPGGQDPAVMVSESWRFTAS